MNWRAIVERYWLYELADEDEERKLAAAYALAEIGSKRGAVPILKEMLDYAEEGFTRSNAKMSIWTNSGGLFSMALVDLGPAITLELLSAIGSECNERRAAATAGVLAQLYIDKHVTIIDTISDSEPLLEYIYQSSEFGEAAKAVAAKAIQRVRNGCGAGSE